MRIIERETVEKAVADLYVKASLILPPDVIGALQKSIPRESDPRAAEILGDLIKNADAAREKKLPLCQDTGIVEAFVEFGREASIGFALEDAINAGVARACGEGRLRASVVRDPLYDRINTGDNTPAIVHTTIVEGDRIRIALLPKGFGSENNSALAMFSPAQGEDDLVRFVCSTVKNAGGKACPPLFIGIGIGGDFAYAPYLSKKALLRPLDVPNPDARYASLENRILRAVNDLRVGPQGFGGDTTALGVAIETYPTHIAGLPVAVNICCHMLRRGEVII